MATVAAHQYSEAAHDLCGRLRSSSQQAEEAIHEQAGRIHQQPSVEVVEPTNPAKTSERITQSNANASDAKPAADSNLVPK
ncbi:uncharacterized protein N7515_000656 [Penicillium bovifimosum]|uniref:Uncharacterized protein n=1 Tax=Penicillium bovifimosum TaxID=126998 RepID=A0A9W9HFU3_9EURO|nr:uncharacterized protein N7515_000656 [Penicillium bovifimosum]KAJ5146092.1 hypothetical protein N7515_000656 [Penicillium bovifimosum]